MKVNNVCMNRQKEVWLEGLEGMKVVGGTET